eukprot:GHVU01059061.1.p1 GENE.GHVU01059061.1~~GHVU01059061.1.p1  ORF type:complete len:123 (-),score=6.87 GHVU01059061.1:247-615(-)
MIDHATRCNLQRRCVCLESCFTTTSHPLLFLSRVLHLFFHQVVEPAMNAVLERLYDILDAAHDIDPSLVKAAAQMDATRVANDAIAKLKPMIEIIYDPKAGTSSPRAVIITCFTPGPTRPHA